jgi:hypothetical protein
MSIFNRMTTLTRQPKATSSYISGNWCRSLRHPVCFGFAAFMPLPGRGWFNRCSRFEWLHVEPKNDPRGSSVMRIIIGIAFAAGSFVLAGCCLWREATGEPEPLPPSPPPPYASAPPSHYAPGPYAPAPYPPTQSYAPAPPSNPQYEDGRG